MVKGASQTITMARVWPVPLSAVDVLVRFLAVVDGHFQVQHTAGLLLIGFERAPAETPCGGPESRTATR
ncbi:hypothetical protein C5E45_33810 [Nocardia nova]|uniref:Uncharacterized protein n=1 Tax=Nocardia nova TaxID=37330 RepID=A0A2S6A9V7_9NOCA|nr:hypothetical protein C5E41_20025 [Nocardia nova]PPJ30308.1 hypothetical protein C5E45_33810 [Nocardia nova]